MTAMTTPETQELAERIDAIGWALMYLVSHLETASRLDGSAYVESLRRVGVVRDESGLPAAAFVLREIAGHLDEARAVRAGWAKMTRQ